MNISIIYQSNYQYVIVLVTLILRRGLTYALPDIQSFYVNYIYSLHNKIWIKTGVKRSIDHVNFNLETFLLQSSRFTGIIIQRRKK